MGWAKVLGEVVVNQPVVTDLQIIGLGAERLLILLNQETGAVPNHHPFIVDGRHGSAPFPMVARDKKSAFTNF